LREPDPTVRAHATAAQLLDRHGILTRAVAPSEGLGGQFGTVYRVLSALEQAGQVRRGYFVEHLGGSQFALPAAVDQVREDARSVAGVWSDGDPVGSSSGPQESVPCVLLAATDPANAYGAALAWPEVAASTDTAPARHRPGRKAGAVVVLVGGALVLYVERGGRTLLSFTQDAAALRAAARLLSGTAESGRLGRLLVQRVDGADVLDRTTLDTPVARALAEAGFGTTPRGLRLRTTSPAR
jgi:ATP-dependent Lhr-like helicase